MAIDSIIQDFVLKYQEITNKKPIKSRDGYLILCPFHNDTNPSLYLNPNGFCYCLAECKGYSIYQVAKEYGISINGNKEYNFFKESSALKKETNESEEILNRFYYAYTDTDGDIILTRVREEYQTKDNQIKKRFYFYEHIPGIGMKLVTGYVPLLLYKLHKVKTSDEVFFVEGEKCVNALDSLGFTATTLPVGASTKIKRDLVEALMPLKGKTVYIIPDNDKPGKEFAKNIERVLLSLNIKCEICYVPNHGEGSDVADWIEILTLQGFTQDEIKKKILELIKEKEGIRASQIVPKQIEWCIPDWIPKGRLTIIAGDPGVGKTRLSLVLAFTKATGNSIFTATRGFQKTNPGTVLYFALEDMPEELKGWAVNTDIEADTDNLIFFDSIELKKLNNVIDRYNPELIIIDHCTYLFSDSNSTKDTYYALSPLVKIAKEKNIAIVLVWHLKKAKESLVKSILGSVVISAIAKRLIILEKQEKQEEQVVVHFAKTCYTPSVAFSLENGKFYWKHKGEVPKFGSVIIKGEEIAKLILSILKENPGGLSYKELSSRIKNIHKVSDNNIKQITFRYLKGKIQKIPQKDLDGKIIGWKWILNSSCPTLSCEFNKNQQKSVTVDFY